MCLDGVNTGDKVFETIRSPFQLRIEALRLGIVLWFGLDVAAFARSGHPDVADGKMSENRHRTGEKDN